MTSKIKNEMLCALSLVVCLSATTVQASLYSDAVLADNPLAYYRFSETSGGIAVDLVSGNDGTYVGSPNLTAAGPRPPEFPGFGITNSATGFDGVDDAVTTPVSLSNLTVFTLEAWVRSGGLQPDRTGLTGQNDAIELGYINDTTIQLWTPASGGLNVVPPPDDEWFHVVGVGTGSETQIYINGASVGVLPHTTGSYGASGFFFNIGGAGVFDGAGNFFLGDIDEVAVYTSALSAAQVQAHYNAALGVPEPATFVVWSLLGLTVTGACRWRRRKETV